MAIRIEIDGTDRANPETQRLTLTIRREVGKRGRCTFNAQSPDGTWKPDLYDTLEVWEPVTRVTDAAMTTGDATLASATAAFTAGNVGDHVSIAGAGAGGRALKSLILSVTDSSHVELEDQAEATVSSAVALIGTCRFLGVLVDVPTARIERIPNTFRGGVTGEDLVGALETLYPRGTYASQTLMARLAALVADTGADDHGIVIYNPEVYLPLEFEDGTPADFEDGTDIDFELAADPGTTVAGRTYDGRTTFAQILADLLTEDGDNRSGFVDTLGRLHAALPQVEATPQALDEGDLQVDARPTIQYLRDDYCNRVVYHYGASLAAYVTAESAAELAALDDRAYERQVDDTSADVTSAATRAANLIALYATRARYVCSGLRTAVDGFEPGQFGELTFTAFGVSGVHLVQSVEARYVELPGQPWHFTLVATNADVRATRPRDYLAPILR